MSDVVWLTQRLKAMSIPEIIWRISQKAEQKKEQYQFKKNKTAVTAFIFSKNLEKLQLDADRMQLNLKNKTFQLCASISLLGGYSYENYKNKWNAGFQTNNFWPEEFSYSLKYKQRDDIGDARTNWELNRHFQFAVLAKNYYASQDIKYLEEFNKLFDDWNNRNPFLWGISWTSVMEVAIRCSNWCYAYCFLTYTDAPQNMLDKLKIGIVNMADYITRHYSRFSSANNHLIVEAYAVGQVGILCNYSPWITLASKILTRELSLQNYSDGVNKELSLHYQAFYMEAMGLLMRLMIKNKVEFPPIWETVLNKMCEYMSTCMGEQGEVVAFGDDDEGKILDLQGEVNYYPYILGLFSYLLDKKFTSNFKCCENLAWLFNDQELSNAQDKEMFIPLLNTCYKEGGNTILRSIDRRVLIGIDHAALGFGNIAAHGHADALSFQIFVDGMPIFVDPGTYLYHCDIKSRNEYRKTENHNTVCIGGNDQSEMLGAFLWGRKAKCDLLEFKETENDVILRARHNGYFPENHTRKFIYDKQRRLEIIDSFSNQSAKTINFLFSSAVKIFVNEQNISFTTKSSKGQIQFESADDIVIEQQKKKYSAQYATQTVIPALCIKTHGLYVKTIITVSSIGGNESGYSDFKTNEC